MASTPTAEETTEEPHKSRFITFMQCANLYLFYVRDETRADFPESSDERTFQTSGPE